MAGLEHSHRCPTEDETRALARRLATFIGKGDVLLLRGNIGAGKSFLARAIIRALCGEETDVPSPTYTLVQAYDAADFEIWHADLYRLSSPDEALELGLFEAFENCLNLVEWPERLGGLEPDTALTVEMSVDGTVHCVKFLGDSRWANRFSKAGLNAA